LTEETQPVGDGFRAELRGPDGRVKGRRSSVGPPPSTNGPVNVVEVVRLLLLRKLTEKFQEPEFRTEIVEAARQEPGTETQIALYLCLEPGHLERLCRALLKARRAQQELEGVINAHQMVKVH